MENMLNFTLQNLLFKFFLASQLPENDHIYRIFGNTLFLYKNIYLYVICY